VRDRSTNHNPAYAHLEGLPPDNSDQKILQILVFRH